MGTLARNGFKIHTKYCVRSRRFRSGGHTFSINTNISKKLTFLSARKCAYHGVRKLRFSEKFAFVLNGWMTPSLIYLLVLISFYFYILILFRVLAPRC